MSIRNCVAAVALLVVMSTSMVALSFEGAAPQTPASSPRKQAYANALIDALDKYEDEVREHQKDAPNSRWLVWEGHGYRLRAVDNPTISLLALRKSQSRAISFAIGIELSSLSCKAIRPGRRSFNFRGLSATFERSCRDGILVFNPVSAEDELRFRHGIEGGGMAGLKSEDMEGTFDLSGVPVLSAMLAVEALGEPPGG